MSALLRRLEAFEKYATRHMAAQETENNTLKAQIAQLQEENMRLRAAAPPDRELLNVETLRGLNFDGAGRPGAPLSTSDLHRMAQLVMMTLVPGAPSSLEVWARLVLGLPPRGAEG